MWSVDIEYPHSGSSKIFPDIVFICYAGVRCNCFLIISRIRNTIFKFICNKYTGPDSIFHYKNRKTKIQNVEVNSGVGCAFLPYSDFCLPAKLLFYYRISVKIYNYVLLIYSTLFFSFIF